MSHYGIPYVSNSCRGPRQPTLMLPGAGQVTANEPSKRDRDCRESQNTWAPTDHSLKRSWLDAAIFSEF